MHLSLCFSAWLKDSDDPVIHNVNNRISDITGLSMESAEELQVSVLHVQAQYTSFYLTWAESSREFFWLPVFHLPVPLSVNFPHFHLLLQNHWVNFNQTWHKASLGEGDSSLFYRRAFYCEVVKIHWRTTGLISTSHPLKHPWMKEIQISLNGGPYPFSRGDNYNKIVKIHIIIFKNLHLQNHRANFNQTWYKASLGEGNSRFYK